MSDWFDDDERFFAELKVGHEAAEKVASSLRDRELHVVVTPMRVRGHVDARHQFADEHDLLVGSRRPCRIDVKSRSETFTGPEDYPYRTAFVDTVSSWRRKTHKPLAIVLLSQRTGDMAVVRVSSESSWGVAHRRDSKRDIWDDFYEVPIGKLATFDELVDWLHARER